MTDLEKEFQANHKALIKSGEDILAEMTPLKMHLHHMEIGVTGEVGELADAIKKYTIYGQDIDLENVIEELGDIEFYLEGVRNALNIERATTLASNIQKLKKRYSSGKYSNDQAEARADKADV